MGLLNTWNDWKKQTGYFENSNQNIEDQFKNADTSRATGSLDTAGGVTSSDPLKQVKTKSGQIKPVQTISRNTGINPNNIQKAMMSPNNTQSLAQSSEVKAATDPIITGGKGVKPPEDMGFMQKLSNMAGVDFNKAAANWKDKGGFEGLMANPAFTLGLALMQSSANGKTINQGILDNFVKSAKISSEFKDRLAAKSDVVEVTEGQTNKIKDVLGTFGISAPKLRKILPGNQSESYEQAVEDIAFKVQNKVNAMIKTAKKKGQKIEVGNRLYKKVIQDMIDSGEIDKKGGLTIGGYNIIDSTLEARAQGGPVQEGKPYVVGEKGPEIIIPRSDGNVLSNDDSQIYAMLLASNPQLQKVSRQRAEKILRNRFPEYFEG
ncbi:phage tail tape measure protein [uncultured Mediterranean phage uvMED]|nr:phage tail tape measure protein [uncultured Mediterranean phage uvMED]